MLSPEELLKPRFKVIAGYPHSPCTVGDIFTFDREVAQAYNRWVNQKGEYTTRIHFESYPHLFKKLAWWEKRKPEDMPEYLKNDDALNSVPEMVNVVDWEMEEESIPCFKANGDNMYTWVRGFIPATEADYLTYKNKNNG